MNSRNSRREALFAAAAMWLLHTAAGHAVSITNVAVNPAFFSPNGDGIQDTSTVMATVSPVSATWTVNVRKPNNTIVRTGTGSGANLSYTWDGKNASGVVQTDAIYTFELIATSGGQATATTTTTLDKTLPVATITSPANNATLSNVYQGGVSDVTVTGTASDANILSWQVDYGPVLGSGTTSVTAGTLATWPTLLTNNAAYTLRLQVWDKAGNYASASRTVTVANFKASVNTIQLNVSAGENVTYTSTVPFSLIETLYVKNAAGQTVRTLVNGVSRPAGTYNDNWNGKNGSVLLPDGGYFYIATVTDGAHNMTWDLSSQVLNDGDQFYSQNGAPQPDAMNNAPLIVTYSPQTAVRTEIEFSLLGAPNMVKGCGAPFFCYVQDRFEGPGLHTVQWPGTNAAGVYQPTAHGVGVYGMHANFPKNAVVVYGTKLQISAVTALPAIFWPSGGTQTIAYTLSTYQSQNATISVSFLSQKSLTILRTMSLGAQAPGVHTAVWDGKADNGMLVSPGTYLVTVAGSDGIGNQSTCQIMTTVKY